MSTITTILSFLRPRRLKWLIFGLVILFPLLHFVYRFLSSPAKIHIRSTKRTALLYAYYEGGYLYHRNFEFFIQNAIWKNDNVDYYLIISGDKCAGCASIPKYPNVKVIYRQNQGFDFGAWGDTLKNYIKIEKYDHFILINPSTRGPFLRHGSHSLIRKHWPDLFTDHLRGNVHLMGTTISCEGTIHAQSFFLAMTRTAMQLMLDNNIFPSENRSMKETVDNSELGGSTLLLTHGYNIASMLKVYEGHDFRKGAPHFCNENKNPATIWLKSSDGNLDPFEVVFWKKTGRHKEPSCQNVSVPCSLDPYIDKLTLEAEEDMKKFRKSIGLDAN